MFQTTNVSSSAVPTVAVVRPSYQIMNTSNNHHTLSPPSSTNPTWRLTTPTPTVVSILNGNSPTFFIATQPSTQTTNIIRQSIPTVNHTSLSSTIINNSNIITSGQIPTILSSNNSLSSNNCADAAIIERLSASKIQQPQTASKNTEEKVVKRRKFETYFYDKPYS